jgi:cytochrome c
MMKKALMSVFVVIFLVGFVGVSYAADKGTAAEAKTLVEKAMAYIKANGKDKAMAEFNNQKGNFFIKEKELYIFVVEFNGFCLANGGNPKLAGKDMSNLQDADGKYFIKAMIELAKTKGSGWVDYKWTNPGTKQIEPKSSYVAKGDDYFVGCGIYK